MIAYKFLRPDGTSVFTRFTWPLPDDGPGPWVDAGVDPCRSGIHACRRADLPLWLGRALYEIEFFKTRTHEHIMRSVRTLFYRAAPDLRELALLRAIFIEVIRTIDRVRRRGAGPLQE